MTETAPVVINDAFILNKLKSVRRLLTDPARWTQGVLARDAMGNSLGWEPKARNGGNAILGEKAASFCIRGAMMRACQTWDYPTEMDMEMFHAIPGRETTVVKPRSSELNAVPRYNNNSDHPTVLAWVDRAIVNVRARMPQSTQPVGATE